MASRLLRISRLILSRISAQIEAWKNSEIVFPHGMGDAAIDSIASMEMTGDTQTLTGM